MTHFRLRAEKCRQRFARKDESDMHYRRLPHGEEQISIIGMGSSVVGEQKEKDIIATVRYAVDQGVNYFDLAAGHATCFPAYGKALKDCRHQVYLQIHFGADYTSGEYGWTTDPERIRRSVDWQLKQLDTDYIDFGFIHCLDEQSDLEEYQRSGALRHLLDLRDQGVVRHIGLSSHTPAVAGRVLDLGIVDMLMFSINPMYDGGEGEYAIGSSRERQDLYRRCEKEGVGISVMKPYNGGILLDARQSPFHQAMTPAQCLQYALDRPGVVTVLPGAGSIPELKQALACLEASPQERDYSLISTLQPEDVKGTCVYCRHCHPCPAGLDIALIRKYYDLARLGDSLAEEHYRTLDRTAADCVHCGHCSRRCPFQARPMESMEEIHAWFSSRS